MNPVMQAAIKEYNNTHATFVQGEFLIWWDVQKSEGRYWSYEP